MLMRPLTEYKSTQFWEFFSYKMFTSYMIPQRVHDIAGGADLNSRMIIWRKKPPLDAGTNNQRFVYVHPYEPTFYKEGTKERKYPRHFYVPFQTKYDLCYGVQKKTESFRYTVGNPEYRFDLVDAFQIIARACNADDPTQKFIPVYA